MSSEDGERRKIIESEELERKMQEMVEAERLKREKLAKEEKERKEKLKKEKEKLERQQKLLSVFDKSRLDKIDDITKNTVNGYIRNMKLLFKSNVLIPEEINYIGYFNKCYFWHTFS